MRAIDYGIQNFGGSSYKNTKSNIVVFNEAINLGNDENQTSELDDLLFHYKEIEFTNEEQTRFSYIVDGELLSGEQFDYIKNSGIITCKIIDSSFPIETQTHGVYTLVKLFEIEEKFFLQLPGRLETVEIIASSKGKKNKPLILLNDILNDKSTSVVVFISDDGVKLEHAYQNIECYNNEVVLFIENDFGSNLFGSVLRIKLGDNITENSNFPASQTAKVINAFKLGIDIDSSTLANAIVEEIKSNDGLLHYIRKRWWAPDKLVTIPLSFSLESVGEIVGILLKGIEDGKFKENRWRYYNSDGTKNKEANLLFFNPDTFDDLEDKAKKNAHKIVFSKALKEVNKIENSLQISLKSINQNKIKFDGTTLTISKTIYDVLNILKPIKEFLSNPEAITISIGKNILIVINAFLVGLINSILDILGGILFLIKLLCSGFIALENIKASFSSYVSMFFEGIENLADTVKNLFTKENLKAFLNFLISLQDILFAFPLVAANFISNTDVSINIDTFGYYYGYIIGVIIDLVIGILLTGGAKTSADVARLLVKQFDDLADLGKKFVKKSGDIAIKSLDEIIVIFAKIKQGVKNIKPFLDEILEFLRTFLGAIPKQLTEYFTKFGITLQKVPQQVLYSGIPTKVGDDIYALIKNGKEIFRGTKNEIDNLAEKLKKMSDKEAKEFIDAMIKRRNALTKWAGKFDENFVNHLSGDVEIVNITQEIGRNIQGAWLKSQEWLYRGIQGQGGHWLNKFLKIDDLVPPPNYTSVADIPEDTPFRARVTIKSLKGKLFPKREVSSMFPRNWSKERIMEEVAFVYENTVSKGLGFKNEINGVKNYEGLSTSGFEIKIQVLDNKIINTHPINF